jgi:hypothetical protein
MLTPPSSSSTFLFFPPAATSKISPSSVADPARSRTRMAPNVEASPFLTRCVCVLCGWVGGLSGLLCVVVAGMGERRVEHKRMHRADDF